ncbi:SMP-30/gluconolactonase/LRE family protein [Anaerobaca lacustris]|uniref:SMP-30/gluconolactonase/LRE family protein n=1 Tax=Anaerobaca lacustris TaxID=3044600 RepID=A0AAW6TY85_9BACT|nr:SMP-30/gluconolactonase/LRE family protein [Sedimentisphaerales bacterium M17dextr]
MEKSRFSRRTFLKASGVSLAAMGAGARTVATATETNQSDAIGTGKGIHPGRVVWVHDPQAAKWAGPDQGHPWQDEQTDPAACEAMMSGAIRTLTGQDTDARAWDALFRHHNKVSGKGDIGYRPGEKITVKVNFVGFIRTHGGVNPETYNLDSWQDYMNTSPQLIAALLKQLTREAGVAQSDIAVGDSLAYFANEYHELLHRQFPDVTYLDCKHRPGRAQMALSDAPLYWSCDPQGARQDCLPQAFVEAAYLVNFANLKAHSGSGVTLCAKNHYGSLLRLPPEKGWYDMHPSAFSKGSGEYRNLVDLMGHSQIGGKTVLYLLDGLYSGVHPRDRAPLKWKSAPFNGGWTSSLFASQDPVAIDSVGLDFLQAELKEARAGGADDYLHEAALAHNPPSGTFYDPDHAGNVVRLASLGAHEHWNNSQERKYSRNLGKREGIELVAITTQAAKPRGVTAPGAEVKLLADGFKFTEGPAADTEGNVFFTDQPNDRICRWSVDGKLIDFMKPCGRSNGMFFDADGNLWTCADMDNELWRIDPQGNVTVFVRNFDGKLLNGPNDLWIDPKGGIYFTDPLYKRPYWTRDPAMQQDGQHVYYVTPDRAKVIRVADDLVQPNGIIGTPDGKLLYVADIGDRKTYRYRISPDATLADKTLFCSMGSDGMTIDTEGNIYLTGRGVTVFNPDGEKVEQIDINKGWTANVCFGGPDRRTLFITAMNALFGISMRVKGVY